MAKSIEELQQEIAKLKQRIVDTRSNHAYEMREVLRQSRCFLERTIDPLMEIAEEAVKLQPPRTETVICYVEAVRFEIKQEIDRLRNKN